jgi:hypothetical protein
MYSWSTETLVGAVLGPPPGEREKLALYEQKRESIQDFLTRVYYELRNLGRSVQDRAINYAATNAHQVAMVFHRAVGDDMVLDRIAAEKSSICRPGSECWDVKLAFFDPEHRFERAKRMYRLTVDVSDVVPVTVGAVHSWSVYQ